MSQDLIADALNEIMNAKRSRKESVIVDRYSKLLLKVLEIAKKIGYIEDYKTNDTKLEISIGKLNHCNVIKPRYNVVVSKIDKYMRRYLPARDMGVIVISTDKGLMTHHEALEKNLGGALIAYFY
jgi:small subunit ribosomal protein S8